MNPYPRRGGPSDRSLHRIQEESASGKSIDLEKRLTQIRLQLPYPVEVVHVIHAADPLGAEAHWHKRFAALRRNGEWFERGEGEVREFKSVSSM